MKNMMKPPLIGLLTPYSGTNLGDGAIQDSFISNISQRKTNAKFIGITLNPTDTGKIHNIDCYQFDSRQLGYQKNQNERQYGNIVSLKEINEKDYKRVLKKYKFILSPIRAWLKLLIAVRRELIHIIKSYKFLKNIDILAVSGGGQLDEYWGGPWYQPYRLFKWSIIARVTKTKFLFISVGSGKLRSKLGKFFIKTALKNADYRTYRDANTYNVVKKMMMVEKDKVFPDLAIGLKFDNKDSGSETLQENQLVIGISPIVYKNIKYWPEKDTVKHEQYINILAKFVDYLLKSGKEVQFFATHKTDTYLFKKIFEQVRKLSDGEDYEMRLMSIEFSGHKKLIEKLKKMDVICASRLHSVIFSHLCYKPVLAISYDPKVYNHMVNIGQKKFCVEINNLSLYELKRKIYNLIEKRDSVGKQIEENISLYKNDCKRQYDYIYEKFL